MTNDLRDAAPLAPDDGVSTTVTAPQGTARARRARALRRYARWLKLLPLVAVVALVVRYRLSAPQIVRRHVVDQGDVVQEVFGRATIESRREVQLGFDLVGRISDVLVDEGDHVKLGQVVAHLAPEQLAADVHAVASGESLARAAIARLEAEERRARAALTFAEQDVARIRALAASGSVSARDLDLAEQHDALARADLDRVRAAQVEAQKGVAVATGATASKSVTATRAALVSPFDGVVIRRFKDPGDTVVVGATVLRIVAVDRLWARAAVDESMLGALRERMPVKVVLLGDAARPLHGTVDRVGREVDRQTHEAFVDVLLATVPPRVAIGQRADVHIEIERRANVTRIPLAFVHREPSGPFVFVDSRGRIARAAISLGAIGRDTVEVTSGVSPGDVVLDSAATGGTLTVGRHWRAGE